MRLKICAALVLLFGVLSLTSCGPQNTTDDQSRSFRIVATETRGATKIVASLESVPATPQGQVRSLRLANSILYAMATDANNEIVAVDFIDDKQKNEYVFDAEHNAVSLVMLNGVFSGWKSEHRMAILPSIKTHPLFASLLQRFRDAGKYTSDDESSKVSAEIAFAVADAYLQSKGHSLGDFANRFGNVSLFPQANLTYAPTAVCTGFPVYTLMSVQQDSTGVEVTSNSLLALNLYLVPVDAPSKTLADIENNAIDAITTTTPASITGVAVLDHGFDAINQLRKSEFKLPTNPKDQAYKIVVSATSLMPYRQGDNAPPILSPAVANTMALISNALSLLGIETSVNQEAYKKIGEVVAKMVDAAFTSTDLYASIQNGPGQDGEGKKSIAANAVAALRQVLEEILTKYPDLFGLGNLQADFVKKIPELALKNANAFAKYANAMYAAAQTGAFAGAILKERSADNFTSAVVSNSNKCPDDPTPPPPPPPSPPDPPTDVKVTESPMDGSPGVEWTKSPSPDGGLGSLLEYVVERADASGNYVSIGRVGANARGFIDNDAVPGVRYTYRVRAVGVGTPAGAPSVPSNGIVAQRFSIPREPGRGYSQGDPHLETFDGYNYDFQGHGEFVLLKSKTDDLEVQIREEATTGNNLVTTHTALAVRMYGDRVRVYAQGRLLINDEAPVLVGAASFVRALPGGGKINLSNGWLSLTSKDGVVISTFFPKIGSVHVDLPPARAGRVRGLLGDFDGQQRNDFALRTGQVLPLSMNFSDFYRVYGDEWRVTASESLFDYAVGESTDTYTKKDFPSNLLEFEDLQENVRAAALKSCQDGGVKDTMTLRECAFDVAVMGSTSTVENYAQVDPSTPRIEVIPTRVVLGQNEYFILKANVAGIKSNDVVWQADAGLFEVLTRGYVAYTAPSQPGTYSLKASVVGNPSLTASATVQVQSAGASGQGAVRVVVYNQDGNVGFNTDISVYKIGGGLEMLTAKQNVSFGVAYMFNGLPVGTYKIVMPLEAPQFVQVLDQKTTDVVFNVVVRPARLR